MLMVYVVDDNGSDAAWMASVLRPIAQVVMVKAMSQVSIGPDALVLMPTRLLEHPKDSSEVFEAMNRIKRRVDALGENDAKDELASSKKFK